MFKCRSRLAASSILLAMTLAAPVAAQEAETTAILDQLDSISVLPRPSICGEAENVTTARQVIHLHTQLMVASLACAGPYGDDPTALYNQYRQFTNDHVDAILAAQSEIETGFTAAGAGPAAYDEFRTEQANDEAQMINNLGLARYCAMREARVGTLLSIAPSEFVGYAEALAQRARAGQTQC